MWLTAIVGNSLETVPLNNWDWWICRGCHGERMGRGGGVGGRGGQTDDFRPLSLYHGVQGQIYDILIQASYESLPAPLATQIPTLWIHTSGGGGGGGGSDIRSMSSIRPIRKCRCPPLEGGGGGECRRYLLMPEMCPLQSPLSGPACQLAMEQPWRTMFCRLWINCQSSLPCWPWFMYNVSYLPTPPTSPPENRTNQIHMMAKYLLKKLNDHGSRLRGPPKEYLTFWSDPAVFSSPIFLCTGIYIHHLSLLISA